MNMIGCQEYGIQAEEKLLIGQCICTPLLRKILADLQRNEDDEPTRLDSRSDLGLSRVIISPGPCPYRQLNFVVFLARWHYNFF